MKVLAIRTPEGHYLEFATIRANLEDGSEIAIDLSRAVFAELLEVGVPDPLRQFTGNNQNGKRDPRTLVIEGAGAIESREDVRGMG